MTGVDIELARAALVIGIVLAGVIYHYFGLVSGGAVTGSYLALMALNLNWIDILGWSVLSIVGVLAIRFAAQLLPLPRAWLFAIGVFAPAAIHATLTWLAEVNFFSDWSNFLVAGLYVTNGLTAYDAQRQGIGKTFLATGIVAIGTLVILIPVEWGMELARGDGVLTSLPTLQDPALVLACIALALAVRVGLNLGTAGIIGALFFVQLNNIASIVVVVGLALIGTIIYRVLEKPLAFTPRQRLYSLLAVGAIVTWFGLFWMEYFGIPGAGSAHQFAVEPLLIVGLMMGEMVRFGIPRMLAGSSLVLGLTVVVYTAILTNPEYQFLVLAASLVVAAALMTFGFRQVRKNWDLALEGGRKWAPTGPGSQNTTSFPLD